MPSRYTDRIIEHLRHEGYVPAPSGEIARDMRIPDSGRAEFDRSITDLRREGRLVIGPDKTVRLPRLEDEVVGVLRVNPRGFGFVIPDRAHEEGDLFVPPDGLRDAISGDRVRASVLRRPGRRGGRVFGRVLEVLERGREHFVGVLFKEGGQWFVQADERVLAEPVLIRDPHARNATDGDKVVIELLHYPDENYLPEGVITKVLGAAGRPDVETEAVIEAHGLRTEFPPEAVEQARKSAKSFDAVADGPWPDREDITDVYTFTIDPPEARDFDDAITIERDEAKERWTLGIHIADVAHFVAAGGPLDEEAMLRGNSVYLPRLVIPMLPEVLSNGVCSLQEDVVRFARSAFITLDDKGNVIGERLARTVIRSNKRLTYLEAQALIDGDPAEARRNARSDAPYDETLVEHLRRADRLARTLRKRRLRHGMIVLNLPEVELVFDDDGHVTDAVPEDDAFTHTIIEMFMVEANEAVARVFSDLDVPVLRRVHPDPVHGDLEELRMYARVAKFDLPDRPTRHDLQRLLDATRKTPASRAIHFAVLRTLTKAAYSPALIGHYALASDHYAHFTSPIRRYPDLSVHRAMSAFLDATDNGRNVPKGGRARDELGERVRRDERTVDEGRLVQLGRHCSDTEKEAEGAERELRTFLVMQFLHEKHLGEEFTGVVTGLTGRGVFVSLERFLVEGLVAHDDLPQPSGRGERWRTNEFTGRLVASRSGASIGIGDVVTVQITAIDVASRTMVLQLTKLPATMLPSGAQERAETVGAGAGRKRGGGKGKGKSKGKGKRKRR